MNEIQLVSTNVLHNNKDDNDERYSDLSDRLSNASLIFVDATRKSINAFRKEREVTKNNQFYSIITRAWTLLFAGIFAYCLDIGLYITIPYYSKNLSIFSRIFSVLSCFIANCGNMLFCTVPLDILDIDIVVTKEIKYYYVRYLISFVGIIMSLSNAVLPPYFFVINIIIALSLIYPDNDESYYWNRFTFKLSIWYIVYAFGLCVMKGYLLLASLEKVYIFETFWKPVGKIFIDMYFFLTLYLFLISIVFCIYWFKQRNLYFTSRFEEGARPTLLVYIAIFFWLSIYGSSLTIEGIWLLLLSNKNNDTDYFLNAYSNLAVGFSFLLPLIIVLIFGQKKIFSIMSHRYDKDSNVLEKDGAFIACLLDNVEIKVGQGWWVHRKIANTNYKECDHNKYWVKGTVVVIKDNEFGVETNIDINNNENLKSIHFIKMGSSLDSDKLLANAKLHLRCVDYEIIKNNELLSKGSVRDVSKGSLYDLSRSPNINEKIDFFISHSWHDNAELKVNKLDELSNIFYRKNGRYPTFWLDKVCIDQNNIGSGLKVLPINIMSCNQMLVLCGETYCDRLWCVWELCTLFSFTSATDAYDKVVILPLSNKINENNFIHRLRNFHISNAKCYDPNEQSKLLKVIMAVGVEIFHEKVHNLASMYLRRYE